MTFYREKLITGAIESPYAADPLPTPALNAVLTRNFQLTPITGDRQVREVDLPTTGGQPSDLTNQRAELSFEVELAGAGSTPTTVVPYGFLLRAAGLAETVDSTVGSEHVDYTRVVTGFESAGLYAQLGRNLHKLLGSRFNVTLNMNADAVPFVAFSGAAMFTPVTSQAMPADANHSAFQEPLRVEPEHTTMVLAGRTLAAESFSVDLNNNVAMRVRTDQRQVRIRNDGATGSFVFEAEDVGIVDFFGKAAGSALEALSVVHGTQEGQIIEVTSPAAEIGEPSYSDSDGDLMLTVPFRLISDGVTPEVTLTTK